VPSFDQCILKLSEAERQANKGILDSINEAVDKDAVVAEIVSKVSRAKREVAMQTFVMKKIRNAFNAYDGATEYTKLMALLTKDSAHGAPYANVEYAARVYRSRFHSKMRRMLERFETKRLGWHEDKDTLGKFVRAVYGETTDDAEINGFAKQWLEMVDETVNLKNKFGASISKNESFLLPQRHDARSLLKLGKTRDEAREAWVAMLKDMVDRRKMTDDQGRELTDEQLHDTLNFVFDSIVTGGMNKLKEFQAPFSNGRKLSRKGSDQRVIYFKDPDSWMKYNEEFGRGDIFGTLTDFIDSSANDIALLELMGPNPNQTFEAFFARAEKDGNLNVFQKGMLRNTWNVVSGKINEGQPSQMSDLLQGYRNIDTAALLGSAFISAISDIGFLILTSAFNKAPAYKVIARQLSQLTNSKADQQLGAQIGLTADAYIHTAHSSNRYADIYGVGVTSKLANTVMRLSMLEPWTNAGRRAFGLEFSGAIAREFGTEWESLDAGFRAMFERNGINKGDWDQFRSSEVVEMRGAIFADFTKDDSMKFHSMVLQETDLAVPTPDAKVRSILTMGRSRESIRGQFWRSAFAIKSFPITIAQGHLMRGAKMATLSGKASYYGWMVASTTMLGGVALQARDIVAGRDPREMNFDFALAAIQQGGGLGIFSDFIYADVNRYGYSMTETVFGPAFQSVDMMMRLTFGNAAEALSGDETNILGELGKAVDRYTPSIWQTKLFEQALFNSFQELADPDYRDKRRKLLRERKQDYNQEYWWKPGEFAPDRLPEGFEFRARSLEE